MAGAERSSEAVAELTDTLAVTLMRYLEYQSVLPGMMRSGLEEPLVQTANSGRHFPLAISLSTFHVYSGVAPSPFDVHYRKQIIDLFIYCQRASRYDNSLGLTKRMSSLLMSNKNKTRWAGQSPT